MNTKVYVVMGKSESCDNYGPFVFNTKPTDEQMKQLAKKCDYDDGTGPGLYGSYTYFTTYCVTVDESSAKLSSTSTSAESRACEK